MTGSDWRIYRGEGTQHDGVGRLPAPPPWRSFDGAVLRPAEAVPDLDDPRPGAVDRARNYRPEPAVVDMVNAALYLRRPLLVTGRPGVGKSTLAFSIAWELALGPVLTWAITSRSQLQQSLYQYDAVGRLQEANLRRLGQEEGPPVNSAAPFISLGPLGSALVARDRPRVLLIDEFDKSDIDLPNDLLHVLEEGEFAIRELAREDSETAVPVATDDGGTALVRGGHVRCNAFPVIVITSNGERAFPDAFRRRCLHVTIAEPHEDRLAEIVRTQLGDEAFEHNEAMFREFVTRREAGESLPTDQLLNAVYLAASGLTDDDTKRRDVARSLLDTAGPGAY